MNVHWLQHVPFEALGSIEGWAGRNNHRITSTRLFTADPLPSLERLDWLVVMGGPMNIYEEDPYPWLVQEKRFIEQAISAGKTVLGICLGAQLIADVLGARVYRNPLKEIGWFAVEKTGAATESFLAEAFPSRFEVFHWHGDTFELPAGAVHLARSKACENQGFIYGQRVVGLQFHLEMTPQGAQQLIANCAQEIVPAPFIQTAEQMLSDKQRFQTINAVMDRLLDQLPQC